MSVRGRRRRQLGLHDVLPALVGQTGGDQQVAPVPAAEYNGLIQPAKISAGEDESGHLNTLDRRRVTGFAGKGVLGQPRQRPGHPVDLMREIGPNTTPYAPGNIDHSSSSHTAPATNKSRPGERRWSPR